MAAVGRAALIASPPTQGKLLPYRLAVLLRHSSDKVPSTLLFLLLRGLGISMSIKADLVLGIFSHTPPSGPYHARILRAEKGGVATGAEVKVSAPRSVQAPSACSPAAAAANVSHNVITFHN